MNYYMTTDSDEYKEGLNTSPIGWFKPEDWRETGGIYFRSDDILTLPCCGQYLWCVDIHEGIVVSEDRKKHPKWYKAEKVNLWGKQRIDAGVIKSLINEGADINVSDYETIRWASEGGWLDVVNVLISEGADIRVCHDEPLRMASKNGYADVVCTLIESGADVHACNDQALRNASSEGHIDVMRVLLGAGADVHACNDLAVKTAKMQGHTDVVNILLKSGTLSEGLNESEQ